MIDGKKQDNKTQIKYGYSCLQRKQQRWKTKRHAFNTQIKLSVTVSSIIDRTKPVLWQCGNNPNYFKAWLNTPLGEMWPNSESRSILFWHPAQWQCTSNPEMNLSANPDYHTVHPPQRHPTKLNCKEMKKIIWLLSRLPLTSLSKLKSMNQNKNNSSFV